MASFPEMIDISMYQAPNNINWNTLKKNNIATIARIGQDNFSDQGFSEHYKNAMNVGAMFGVYFFFQPNVPADRQITNFLSLWNALPTKPKVIALDVEDIVYTGVDIKPPSKEAHTVWLTNWLTSIEKATKIVPAIYTRQNYWDAWTIRSGQEFYYNGTKYTAPQWNHFPLWIASWFIYTGVVEPRLPQDWKNWLMWQYEGGTGRMDGVIGPVDKNYFHGSLSDMESYFGQTPSITPPVNPPQTDLENRLTELEARVLKIEDYLKSFN